MDYKNEHQDIGIRSSQAAQAAFEREQQAAQEYDTKTRENAQQADQKARDALKAEQDKAESIKAQEQAKRQAEQGSQELEAHAGLEVPFVNHRDLDREHMAQAAQIRAELEDRGDMRNSHAQAYSVRGSNIYEQAANRELDADRDFARRQDELAGQISEAQTPQERAYLETLKAAEYDTHKFESWQTIVNQREELGYSKADIEYARNQAASFEAQAALHLERLYEMNMSREAQYGQTQEQGKNAPEQAAKPPQQAQQGQGSQEPQKAQETAQNKPLEQSVGQGVAYSAPLTVNLDFSKAGDKDKAGSQSMPEPNMQQGQQLAEPRDMGVLNRIREQSGREGLRGDILKLEERHNAAKAERGEHSHGLRGDIERLEQRHNAEKSGREQERPEPSKPRSSHDMHM